jgi:glucose/arabinose dehydrogenase
VDFIFFTIKRYCFNQINENIWRLEIMSRKEIVMGITGISLVLLVLAGTGIAILDRNEGITSLGETNLTPKIISLLPSSPAVNNQVGEMRTFTVITNQEVNITWFINGTQVLVNSGSTASSYINNSAQMGSWNVTAVVENGNGTDMHKWDWIVKAPPPVSVEIKNLAFNPAQINVSKGTTVIWTNNDSVAHTVTSDTNVFDSGTLNPGQTFEWTFDQIETFKYHCSIHSSMKGEVNVVQATAPIPPPMEEIGIGLELVADNLTAPVALVSPEDGTGRRFIVDQIGVIKILTADGQILQEPFLNLSSKIISLTPQYDERGLLGLAFHPNFSKNGRFFVYYSAPLRPQAPNNWDVTSTISEFKVSQGNPNITNMSSERILLQVDKPQSNHNAGQIAFGPDGYLYIPIGDGGRADDVGIGHPPPGNGQNISTLLGKILRIDVDNGDPYGIPPDNPFVGKDGLDEIFAYGLRNPFRIAFDAGGNHSLFESDAGQNSWEEVNIVTKGSNYGWNIKEGTHCFDPNNPNLAPESCLNVSASGQLLIDPIIEYANAGQPGGLGIAIIGGSVYRGNSLPQFNGTYIFGDFSKGFTEGNGSLFVARQPPAGEKMWSVKELRVASHENGRIGAYVRSFGQDTDNEMYVMTSQNLGPSGNTGKVFKIKPFVILTYYRSLGNDPNVVETTDLLKAADDWSRDTTPQGFTSPITTQQLLTLADEWSST